MRILGKLAAVLLVLLLLSGSYTYLTAATSGPTDLSSQVIVTTSNERTTLDPATGDLILTADADIINASSRTISAPLHAVIDVGGSMVSMPGALGGPAVGPYGKYYYDLSARLPNQTLAPSATLRFNLKIVSRIPVRYGIHTYGTLALAPANNPPVAEPGADRTVFVGSVVQLDGSRSSDADGNPLSYRWTILSTPAGGQTTLSDPSAVKPSFRAIAVGTYVIQLTVNDGKADSVPRTVTFTTSNAAPVANAGSDVTVAVGSLVKLDGSRSIDPNGDPLQYHWWLVTAPPGSRAALDSVALNRPSFIPDLPGTYVARLVVSDGRVSSDPVKVVISTLNSTPRADAGSNRSVQTGEVVTLDGSRSSDPDNHPLSYRWALLAKPGTSNAFLANPANVKPTFIPDRAGTYVAQLIVNDGATSSSPATVTIEAVLSDAEKDKQDASAKKKDSNKDKDKDKDKSKDDLRLNPIPNQTVKVGKTLTLRLSVVYTDDDRLTYSVTPLPANSSLNASTGVFTFTPSSSQAGMQTLTFKVTDGKKSSSQIALITVEPNAPPMLSPPGDYAIRVGQTLAFTLTAIDPEGGPLTYAVQPLPANASLDAATGAFSFTPVATQAGILTLNFSASDGFSRSTKSSTITIKTDTPPVLAPIPDKTVKAGATLSFNLSATDSDGDPITFAVAALPTNASLDANTGAFTFSPSLAQVGRVTVTFTASDGRRSATQTATITVEAPPATGLPPDPATVAPPVDPTVATDILAATAFLYTGTNPIQTGVAPGTIELRRIAVLRGKVLSGDGVGLSSVKVSVLDHPEFGQTLTRVDGAFDLAVNGGGQLTLRYEKDGLLAAQRAIVTPWRDYAWLPDIVMIPFDSAVTAVDLSAASMQVARGSAVSDADGARQATIFFPQGTTATMVLPSGATQPLTTLNVRATEYTVGASGPQAMPASLPSSSGYTYAVELSVDEAVAAGASEVRFSQALPVYVENFIDFPVGTAVPSGYYDRLKGQWIASANGRVIKVLSITGGMADLDLTGSGIAANDAALIALGVTAEERTRLAQLYTPGQTLWRVPITHFTPWDCNWPYGPPPDAISPPGRSQNNPPVDKPNKECGSVIGCEDQTLGESLPITGTPWQLHYQSERTPGRKEAYTLNIPVSGAILPASLRAIRVEVSIAGRLYHAAFVPAPNSTLSYFIPALPLTA